jgi:hypothetical protein
MKVLGVLLHKPDARSTLIMLAVNIVVFAILMAIDHAINKHVDLPFVGLIFVAMIWYRLLELMGISPKEAGWKAFVLQVISTTLIIIGYVFITMS